MMQSIFSFTHYTNSELLSLLTQTDNRSWLSAPSLSVLFTADLAFLSSCGVTPVIYNQFQASCELQKRYLAEKIIRQGILRDSEDAKDFLLAYLRPHTQEVFACLFLDGQHRIIQFETLFTGSLRETPVHSREVIKRALFHNAAALIVAHNHPSGDVHPSSADRTATKCLKQALELMEIRLLDHVIVGGPDVYSFAEHGLLV